MAELPDISHEHALRILARPRPAPMRLPNDIAAEIFTEEEDVD